MKRDALPGNSDKTAALIQTLRSFSQSNDRLAIWQLVNTLIPYVFLFSLMVILVRVNAPYWLVLLLAILAALFLVRIFILFHDTCHGSLFSSTKANTIVGYLTGILTFTPYFNWRHSHAIHHSTAGNLDKRGTGDVWTMTVEEFKSASKRKRIAYRFIRHPLIMFGFGPVFMFIIMHRFADKQATKRDRQSVVITNLTLLAVLITAHFTIGFNTYILVQLPIIYIAGILGLWLFYIQHQYETVYWVRNDAWNRMRAALEGASYYKLPKLLQWFTGSIGFHHIHHLRASIPNYNLQKCYDSIPAVQNVIPITLRTSMKSLWMHLFDESTGRMVSFRHAMSMKAAADAT
jgi:omega-6 fatty acid desaturase (delta-12 desaturase)